MRLFVALLSIVAMGLAVSACDSGKKDRITIRNGGNRGGDGGGAGGNGKLLKATTIKDGDVTCLNLKTTWDEISKDKKTVVSYHTADARILDDGDNSDFPFEADSDSKLQEEFAKGKFESSSINMVAKNVELKGADRYLVFGKADRIDEMTGISKIDQDDCKTLKVYPEDDSDLSGIKYIQYDIENDTVSRNSLDLVHNSLPAIRVKLSSGKGLSLSFYSEGELDGSKGTERAVRVEKLLQTATDIDSSLEVNELLVQTLENVYGSDITDSKSGGSKTISTSTHSHGVDFGTFIVMAQELGKDFGGECELPDADEGDDSGAGKDTSGSETKTIADADDLILYLSQSQEVNLKHINDELNIILSSTKVNLVNESNDIVVHEDCVNKDKSIYFCDIKAIDETHPDSGLIVLKEDSKLDSDFLASLVGILDLIFEKKIDGVERPKVEESDS